MVGKSIITTFSHSIYLCLTPPCSSYIKRMNCLLETIASMWLLSRRAVGIRAPVTEEDESVREGLIGCRMSLEAREAELVEGCRRLGREALRRRQQGDPTGARLKLLERRRVAKRLDKLRNSLVLVDAQMDALQSTELDREVLQTLVASSNALKKAGVGTGVREAEAVMSELDEQMRESGELTSVLSGPLAEDAEFDVEEELNLLLKEGELEEEPAAQKTRQPSVVNQFADHRIPAALPSAVESTPRRATAPTVVADLVSAVPQVHGF